MSFWSQALCLWVIPEHTSRWRSSVQDELHLLLFASLVLDTLNPHAHTSTSTYTMCLSPSYVLYTTHSSPSREDSWLVIICLTATSSALPVTLRVLQTSLFGEKSGKFLDKSCASLLSFIPSGCILEMFACAAWKGLKRHYTEGSAHNTWVFQREGIYAPSAQK